MAEKIFNTRIQLKYDTYANWTTANTELKTGEVAVVQIPGNTYTKYEGDKAITVQNPPHILFKVGPGNFNDLDWTSAKAADVYAWAKAKTVVYEGQHIKFKGAADEDLLDLNLEEFVTASELEAITGDLTQLNTQNKKDLVTAINEALQAVEVGGTGSVVTVVKEATPTTGSSATYTVKQGGNAVGDKIEIPDIDTGVHAVSLEGGTNDGTLKLTVDEVSTDNIKVTGLEDAAYTTVASLNETAKGYADAVEAQLPTSADYGVLKVAAGTGIEVGGTDQNPTVSVKANTYDAYGAASAVETGVKNGTIKAKDAENADTAEHADAATKVDKAITVKVGGADVVFDGSAAKTVDVDEAIAAGVAEAKDYADEHDANTEYHIEYDSTNKKIKLIAGADAKKMEIDATDFIKDGMIDTVTIGKDNDLVITFNTAAGKDDIVLPLDQLVDIYTAKENATEVQVAIDNTNVVSATLVNGGVSTAKIANNAVTVDKLADSINLDIAKGVAAKNAVDNYGDIVTHNASEFQPAGDYKTIQDKVDAQNLSGATVIKSVSQDTNGKITVATREITPANIGAEAAGTAQGLIDALDIDNTYAKIANLSDVAKTGSYSDLKDLPRSTLIINGDTAIGGSEDDLIIVVQDFIDYPSGSGTMYDTEYYDINTEKLAEKLEEEHFDSRYETSGTASGLINSLDSSVAATAEANNKVSVLTGVTQTNGKLTEKTEVTLAAVAKTGDVGDLTQTNGDILVFNCGTASTVI